MELLSPQSRWYAFVSVDPERLGGEPVFRGTRVPVRVLFECLRSGRSLAEFLNEFEGVPKHFATAVLTLLGGDLLAEIKRNTRRKPSAKAARGAAVRTESVAGEETRTELLSPESRLHPFVSVDPERMHGTPIFRGTRVPARTLIDCLEDGQSLAEFLDDFEGVPKESAVAVLNLLGGDLLAEIEKDTLKKSRKAA